MKGKDIYKCGFVQAGVLPKKAPRKRAVTHCRTYYPDLAERGDVYLGDYNCGPIVNGYDPCNDARAYSKKSSTCPDATTYYNFESDNPSPLNVFGTGQGGFRGVRKDNRKTWFQYRTEYQIPTSKGVLGIILRAPKWAFGHSDCVTDEFRKGGPLKKA